MIIEIISRRKLEDKDFWAWAETTRRELNARSAREQHNLMIHGVFVRLTQLGKEDFQKLWDTGEMSFSDKVESTEVTTTYRIVERQTQ